MRRAVLAAAALLAACETAPEAPAPTAPARAPAEEGIVVLVGKTGTEARKLLHDVAVQCWLDGVVRGAQLFVWPDGSQLRIVGEDNILVETTHIGRDGDKSRWRMTGDAIDDPILRTELVTSLDHAARTGETACPIKEG